ncbi:MAG: pantoate--beta-alanine ligase [Sedimentisphaerales bacterium]|nr:pantoate--beta-alanine ligase [Sedimentisphaerales bacterium]
MEFAGTIELVRSVVKAVKIAGKRVGLVPTMGALHAGHISLIKRAVKDCHFVVVSIFVNPTQFGAGEDFENYPRPIEADLEICEKAGADLVFNPSAEVMYGGEGLTWITVEKLTEPLCGRSRPGHFRGVATICAKLFNIVQPDVAYFGQKDAQQAIVIRRMVADLDMPLEVVVCPTVREPDGLALSSRNKYLSVEQRREAAKIYKSLAKCKEMREAGVTDAKQIIAAMREILRQIAGGQIEYVEIVDAETLEQVNEIKGSILGAVAVRLGPARLIDNILL